MPNFIEIGQISLEKNVKKIGPQTKKIFVTDSVRESWLKTGKQLLPVR